MIACQPAFLYAVRYRPYPPSNSSEPSPFNKTRAVLVYGLASASGASRTCPTPLAAKYKAIARLYVFEVLAKSHCSKVEQPTRSITVLPGNIKASTAVRAPWDSYGKKYGYQIELQGHCTYLVWYVNLYLSQYRLELIQCFWMHQTHKIPHSFGT